MSRQNMDVLKEFYYAESEGYRRDTTVYSPLRGVSEICRRTGASAGKMTII